MKKLAEILILVSVIAILTTTCVFADECNDFIYSVYDDEAVITGYIGSDTNITIPDTLDGYPVTAIGDEAFMDKGSITRAVLPSTIKSIGARAFKNSGVGLNGDFILPGHVTYIGEDAFRNSSVNTLFFAGTQEMFENITVGTSWDQYSFESAIIILGGFDFVVDGDKTTITGYFGGKSSVNVPRSFIPGSKITAIAPEAFKDDDGLSAILLPYTLESIGERAFANCGKLSLVNFGEGIISIAESAFENCVLLKNIDLPESLQTIGKAAFRNCDGLSNVIIRDNVTAIGESAYENSGITSVSLPRGLKTIGKNAFKDCESLSDIYYRGFEEEWALVTRIAGWNDNLPIGNVIHFLDLFSYNSYAVGNTITAYNGFDADVVIPTEIGGKTVIRINNNAFSYGVESIYIPDTVTNVNESAFQNLSTLESLEFGGGITTIREGVCMNDTALKEVFIPASVDSVSSNAFKGCTSLTDIYFGGTSEQWNSISFAVNWTDVSGFTVHYQAQHLPRYSVNRPAPEDAAATNLRKHSALRFTANSLDYNSFDIFGFLISRRDSMEAYGFKTLTHKNLVSGEPLYVEAICVDDTHNRIYAEDNLGTRTYSILASVPEDKKDTVFVVRPFLVISGATVYGNVMSGSFNELNV